MTLLERIAALGPEYVSVGSVSPLRAVGVGPLSDISIYGVPVVEASDDDNEAIEKVIKFIVKDYGIAAVEASEGVEAVIGERAWLDKEFKEGSKTESVSKTERKEYRDYVNVQFGDEIRSVHSESFDKKSGIYNIKLVYFDGASLSKREYDVWKKPEAPEQFEIMRII